MKKKRVFTVDEKMQILREVEQNGMLVTCRKHEIAQSLYYHWKNKFDYSGVDGLQRQYKRIDPDMRELEKENVRFEEDHWKTRVYCYRWL